MRRASPPASTRPSVDGNSVVMHRRLAPMFCALLLDRCEILVEDDALFAGKRYEALAARPSDQREIRLARELDAPGREPRAGDEDGDAHAHSLDHHFRSEPAGGVENLVVRAH